MMRWWWFGPSVERGELDRELTAMRDAGLGGVEVAYVYPLGEATTTLLSPEFLADLRFAAERARALGLRFDLTLGSGWSFGGPHITPEHAAKTLHWEWREIPPAAMTFSIAAGWPGDEFVAAYLGNGGAHEHSDEWRRLEVTDRTLTIPAGDGPRQVLTATSRLTGQNVKRAAAGAEGPVLDHYSEAAAVAHVRAFGDPLLDAVPAQYLGSVFCDSLEVYESNWTPDLVPEFERRRGYDPLPRLYQLATRGPAAAEFRADYYRTLTELYEERFLVPIQRWAAERGVPFRIQGYGTPPAMVSSYRFADCFEGEGWGWTELTQTRWASSAAHLYGRQVVSSEIWTWVHSPSFRATPLDLKGEAHEHLLAGINQFVGHGWPYSPQDAPGLGWFFYASGALDDRNPWWPAMPALTQYLSRLCWLMRQGEPVADVLVYVPSRDVYARMGSAIGGSIDAWRETTALLGDELPALIRRGGWDFDLIDDDALAVLRADEPRVVIVPQCTTLAEPTRLWLEAVVRSGGSVIMWGSTAEVAGGVDADLGILVSALSAAVPPEVRLEPATDQIGIVHRRTADADIYLVVNTGPEAQTFTAFPRTERSHVEEWDAETDTVRRAVPVGSGIAVALAPYQATVLTLTDAPEASSAVGQEAPRTERIALTDGWTVRFADGAAEAVTLPHEWEAHLGRGDYSGAATYRCAVELGAAGAAMVLDFGAVAAAHGDAAAAGIRGHSYRATVSTPVREVALVRVNGVECGVAWAPPYAVDVSAAVRAGRNEIEVVVWNTAANALAHDDAIEALVEQTERAHGRRFRMQELDRAMEGVRSGLLAVPALVISSAGG